MKKTTKIININTKKEQTIVHHGCSICDCAFSEQEGGLINGMIGILPVNFCPTCFSGIFSMVDYFRGENDAFE
tara:strand:+ start:304 stop:522 length:219 start_codon:yes stop_codon:yes gene_type:complete